MDLSGNTVVPMRLFANWETDRTTACVVQRMFTMAISRLVLSHFSDPQSTLVITVKLQGYKRTLRSNDFSVSPVNGKLDVDLNVSFHIQYPHFFKRKRNILQILLQRRKRYKSRPILGYKTLAIGFVNLAEILQNGLLREILLFDPDTDKEDLQLNTCIGRMFVVSCQSQSFEAEDEMVVRREKEKELESEEEEESSTDVQLSENDNDIPDSSRAISKSRLKMHQSRERKIAHRKNLKQKFTSLLRKFKVPEEGIAGEASHSGTVPPTAEELQELFDELENLSDSGPEMIMDTMSIMSNPRPGLRPYFTSSSREEPSEDSDEDWSSELENAEENATSSEKKTVCPDKALSRHAMGIETSQSVDCTHPVANMPNLMLTATASGAASGSGDNGTLVKGPSRIGTKTTRVETISHANVSVAEQLASLMHDDDVWGLADRLWLYSFSETPVLSRLESTVPLLECSTFADCRLVISSVVAKIQKFCNSSSRAPSCTVIGIVGGDSLVNFVLRAYVETLQNKSVDWSNYLRFCVVVPSWSAVSRLIAPPEGNWCFIKDVWERPAAEITPAESKDLSEKLKLLPFGSITRLPICEAMLQLYVKGNGDDKDSRQVFVPFVSEVKVSQLDDESESSIMNSPRNIEEAQAYTGVMSAMSHMSPPSSPHTPQKPSDCLDLQVEYWISNSQQLDNVMSSPTGSSVASSSNNAISSGKRDIQLAKCSLRSTFRSFSIFRKSPNATLSLQFIKERKKEKMLQKLGMKKGQKYDSEGQPVVQNIGPIARLICSGKQPLTGLRIVTCLFLSMIFEFLVCLEQLFLVRWNISFLLSDADLFHIV
ncbi:hypothetical protein AB6A40_005237 [Gnathostoma spinigerum]|uniref:Phosphofurin acidic cluster sorting protein 2 n=1 Tax=Gnathostoma spinigerum TaxID=75299 RepID=A0ABD6EF05_9BILA